MKLQSGEIKLRTFNKTDIPRLVELANNENISKQGKFWNEVRYAKIYE